MRQTQKVYDVRNLYASIARVSSYRLLRVCCVCSLYRNAVSICLGQYSSSLGIWLLPKARKH
jgi:hypothetical protein